ncbi:MAG: GDSL-type esterase/lipase family protein [Armatimonadota bacterium]
MRNLIPALIALALTPCVVALAAPGDQMLDNPGFEKGPWAQSPAWKGEMTVVDEPVFSGDGAGRLVAEDGGAMAYTGYVPVTVGLDYRFTIHARGVGSLQLRSTQLRNHPEDRYIIERPEPPVELTDQWREIAIEISPRDPLVTQLALVVELSGEDAVVYLDNALLTAEGVPGAELTVEPGYVMIAPGESVDLRISARTEAGPLTEGALTAMLSVGEYTEAEEVTIAGETTALPVSPPTSTEPGQATITIASAEIGAGASVWGDVVDAETFAEYEALAAAAPIDTPAHILFLGDSLTDQRRGHNYTDMVGYWLHRVNGDVSYRNAGVGGDYITRMWQRLQGEGAHRQEMYDDLFEPTPTHVFIWLGHNDSKLRPKPEYETPEDYPFDPVVPLDEFEETFVAVIGYIRENVPEAQFTLLSSSSSVHEITRATVITRIEQRGSGGSYFGRPDVLEAFNERMRSVCEATGAAYLDVYEPTRAHPDRPSLFTADGVHMTHEGNLLVAREILAYLGE